MAQLSSIIEEIAAVFESVGASGSVRTREITERHTPTTTSRLAVATRNGAIDLHPTDGDEFTIDATAKTQHEDDDLEAVTIDIHQTPQESETVPRTPDGRSCVPTGSQSDPGTAHQNPSASEEVDEAGDVLSVSAGIPKDAKGISVDLDIGVPHSLVVAHVVSKNGSVGVRDVEGDARVETKNGKITVERVQGTVTALTKNGAVSILDTPIRDVASKNGSLTIVLPALTEAASVETKNGAITIAVPKDLDADYRLDTTRGRVTVEGLTTIVESSSRTHATGELGTGGPLLEAHTKNGSVTLRARDD